MPPAASETIEQLRAENERLRAQAADARSLWFDAISDAIVLADMSWHITDWNAAAEQLYGWPRAEVIGRPINDIIAAVRYLGADSDATVMRALDSAGVWRGDIVQRTHAGQTVIVEGLARTLTGPQGAIGGYILINRDITARAHAEQALRAREEQYRQIIETAHEGIWQIDAHTITTFVNARMAAMLGYTPDEMVGLPLHAFVDPADHTAVSQMVLRRHDGVAEHVERRFRHKDGREIWALLAANPLHDPAGAYLGALAMAMEITDRRRVEHALRESEERFRTIIENGSEGVLLVGSDRTTRYVSPSITALLGYPADLFATITAEEICHPDDQPAVAEFIAMLTGSAGASGQITTRVRHADGRWRWMEQSASNQAHNPAIGAIIISYHDVTERVQAEQGLRRAADRIATIHAIDRAILALHAPATIASAVLARVRELIPCRRTVVVLHELDGGLRLLATNGNFDGAQPDGTPLPPLPEAVSAAMRRGEPEIHHDLRQSAGDDRFNRRLLDAGIRSFMRMPMIAHWELIGTLNLVATEPNSFTEEHVTIAQEISNTLAIALHNARLVESLQQELAARTRAEAALIAEHTRVIQLKNEFMATMSHELRTPLNAVLGHTELLQDQIYGPLTERQSAALRTVEQSGRHLLVLINDILDYAKFEAGQVELDLAPVSVAWICRESVRAVAQTALIKHIVLTTTLDSAITTMPADARRLQQVLTNLLSNAVKFTPAGGEVGLEVRGDAAREQVVFTIWDTGIGIAEADIARLFQPFTQLDGKLSRQYEGTGLGLALVRRLAEAHGGTVSVTSAAGSGSRFSVALPWSPGSEPAAAARSDRPAPQAAEPRRQVAPPGAPPLILLVEDRQSNIEVIFDTLAAHGYRVAVAQTGDEALERASQERPALVLMDIQLPGMSGIEVIQRMRADPALRPIPIIALTALAMPGDRERCLQAGADGYLAKPVSLHVLLDTIASQLA